MKLISSFILLFLIASLPAFSQDIIKTKKDQIIKAKVLEIGIDEIKYKDFENQDGPVIVILKSDVKEIRYENGSRLTLVPDAYEAAPEINIRDRKRAIKIDFFAPLFNHITFGYETVLKVGTNLEVKAGVIGPGFSQHMESASGGFVKVGVKFLKTADYYVKGVKFSHALKGGYIRPEFIFNSFRKELVYNGFNPATGGYYYEKANATYTNYAFNICFGKQSILGNAITFDYFVGVGYGGQNIKVNSSVFTASDFNYDSYVYTHTVGENTPIVFSAGMTFGVLF